MKSGWSGSITSRGGALTGLFFFFSSEEPSSPLPLPAFLVFFVALPSSLSDGVPLFLDSFFPLSLTGLCSGGGRVGGGFRPAAGECHTAHDKLS
jgi:hypothetical protein